VRFKHKARDRRHSGLSGKESQRRDWSAQAFPLLNNSLAGSLAEHGNIALKEHLPDWTGRWLWMRRNGRRVWHYD
jgi:hypothetical protein